jgi:hypothetical protein
MKRLLMAVAIVVVMCLPALAQKKAKGGDDFSGLIKSWLQN